MGRRSLTLAVAVASLIAGACAGKIQVTVTQPQPVLVAVPEPDIATLPVRPLQYNDLLLPPAIAAVPEDEAPDAGCDVASHIDEARTLLETAEIAVGAKSYRYTEYRAGSGVTFKDAEKRIALALMNSESCELLVTSVTKRGDDAVAEAGFAIEPVTRSNGIRWNNWATEFRVTTPVGYTVLALKYPFVRNERVPRTTTNKAGKRVTVYDTRKVTVPVYYTPYSRELHLSGLVQSGEAYLADLADRAFDDLRGRGVPSLSAPGTPVADVDALEAMYVIRLAPIEHMDMTEFLLDPTWTTERIHIVIGANRERVATYTCSKASACGLMQFTAGTYAIMRRVYPDAGLIASFEEGARDQLNAMKAAILLHDYNTAQLVKSFGADIMQDPRLEEYLAAAYNTGVGRVIAVLAVARSTHATDWAEADGKRKGTDLLNETKGYIAKLRFLRDQWQPQPLARTDTKTPEQ